MINARRKATLAMVGMLATAGLAVAAKPRQRMRSLGPNLDLNAEVPQRFGGWEIDPTIVPLQADPQMAKVIAETYEQTLARTYRDRDGYRVMLSMAYGGQGDGSMQAHRPEVCYPAQGLNVRRNTFDASLQLTERALPLRRLVAGSGARNEPISYWLVVGNSLSNFGYSQRLATLRYGLTGQIPDGMLVRVSSVDESSERSFKKQEDFLQAFFPALQPRFRERLMGAL